MSRPTHFARLVLAARPRRGAGFRAMERVLIPDSRGTSCDEIARRLRLVWREQWAPAEVRVMVLMLVHAGACERRGDGYRIRDWDAVARVAREEP